MLLYGPEIERAGGWDAGIKFAERLRAPVYMTPLSDKASFPQTHPQFRGMAPFAIGALSKKLRGHDLIIVVGAQVFRYYPYVAGDYLPEGAELLQITSDPYDAAAAIVGDSLLADAKLALAALYDAIPEVKSRPAPAAPQLDRKLPSPPNSPLTALEAFAALSELRPANAILVNETASNFADLAQYWPINEPGSYYTFASGGLGWGEPAAVGVAIAQKKLGTGRPVIAAIGDWISPVPRAEPLYSGSRETKAHLHRPLQRRVAILTEFAVLEKTPNVPELDLRAAIEAADVGDEGVDQITKAARSGRSAVEARQQVLVVRHCGTSARRELARGR